MSILKETYHRECEIFLVCVNVRLSKMLCAKWTVLFLRTELTMNVVYFHAGEVNVLKIFLNFTTRLYALLFFPFVTLFTLYRAINTPNSDFWNFFSHGIVLSMSSLIFTSSLVQFWLLDHATGDSK